MVNFQLLTHNFRHLLMFFFTRLRWQPQHCSDYTLPGIGSMMANYWKFLFKKNRATVNHTTHSQHLRYNVMKYVPGVWNSYVIVGLLLRTWVQSYRNWLNLSTCFFLKSKNHYFLSRFFFVSYFVSICVKLIGSKKHFEW